VRFHEPMDDILRTDLTELVRRRGRASERAAARIDPIELVVADPCGERERMIGGLRPPQRRHGQLCEIAALKFAAHRQLARWARRPTLAPRQYGQRAALKRAVHVLQCPAFARGCELCAPSGGGEQ
jgi:hypothetical protein